MTDQSSTMSDSRTLMVLIERLATSKDVDLERVEKLLALKERWDANEARKAYVAAMASFKAEPLKILKTKDVNIPGGAKFKHATLADVCDGVVSGMGKHGLSACFAPRHLENGWLEISCIVTHAMGHSERFTMRGPPDDSGKKNPLQQIGSTQTYLERYTLMAACGLGSSDMDDVDDKRGPPSAPAVQAPEGYAQWRADMSAKAEEGTAPLQAAWKGSSGPFRGHAVTVDQDWWIETKRRAVKAEKTAEIVR